MQWLIDIIAEKVLADMKGIIVMWSGAHEDIPNGWRLCDGTAPTPNLRSKFIMASDPTFPLPGKTGGFVSHAHSGTTSEEIDTLDEGLEIVDNFPGGDYKEDTEGHDHDYVTPFVFHLPPYYVLAYIMKL